MGIYDGFDEADATIRQDEIAAGDTQSSAASAAELSGPALTPEQWATLFGMFEDAIAYRETDGDCSHCDRATSGLCGDHAVDEALAEKYRELEALLKR